MARCFAILLSTLLGLNIVLGGTIGPTDGQAGAITICLGHAVAHHSPHAAAHRSHIKADCDEEEVHLHLSEHSDCCCSDLPLTITEAPNYARTDSEFATPQPSEAFPLPLPPLATATCQWRPSIPPPGDDPCSQLPRRLARTTQLRL